MTHNYLVQRAERWLKNTIGCSVVITELTSFASENPDAIGFRSSESILVECKISRADFFQDQKKFFRQTPSLGMGQYRFYLCPPEIIKIEDLPEGWGLLWCEGKKIKKIKGFNGNCRLNDDVSRFETNIYAERTLLVSQLRRLQTKEAIEKGNPVISGIETRNNYRYKI